MCRAMEELRKESINIGVELVAVNMIKVGKENNEIRELTSLSEEKINELRHLEQEKMVNA